MDGGSRLVAWILSIAVLTVPAGAQSGGVGGSATSASESIVARAAPMFSRSTGIEGVLAPAASVLLPGVGQLMQRQDRAAFYLFLEAALITGFIVSSNDAALQGDRFRGLAFDVARAAFSPTRRDTTFEYFEQMAKFLESGLFDVDPGPAIAPPLDERTFNGSIWALARRTFLNPESIVDPQSAEYQRALDFYRDRAVGPSFLWSWRGAEFAQDEFRQAIERRNDASRRRSAALGFLLANHLLSALDSFVSTRLASGMPGAELTTKLRPDGSGRFAPMVSWTVVVAF